MKNNLFGITLIRFINILVTLALYLDVKNHAWSYIAIIIFVAIASYIVFGLHLQFFRPSMVGGWKKWLYTDWIMMVFLEGSVFSESQ